MLPGEALNQDISESEILHVVSKHPTVDLLKLLAESDWDPYSSNNRFLLRTFNVYSREHGICS